MTKYYIEKLPAYGGFYHTTYKLDFENDTVFNKNIYSKQFKQLPIEIQFILIFSETETCLLEISEEIYKSILVEEDLYPLKAALKQKYMLKYNKIMNSNV